MITKFFCENLLSDYYEQLLPDSRRKDVEAFLAESPASQKRYSDMTKTLDWLHQWKVRPIPQDVALSLVEQAQSRWKPKTMRKVALLGVLLVVFAVTLVFSNENYQRYLGGVGRGIATEENFVRYYPMFHSAGDILQEHEVWIRLRDSLGHSVWEEGGLLPEEVERALHGGAQVK